jgi:endothelin-converting enzyme/putative endopeptidase
VDFVDNDLGEALGRVFVEENFGKDGKDRTLAMVQSLEKSFESDLGTLTWMDDVTRTKAKVKIQAMINKIGYPDAWRDYASVKTDRTSFFANSMRANLFAVKRDLAKIGKPVDKNEWLMTPPTVNAYNNPPMNEIVFPAGILQPPFFDRAASDAVNFGAMGMVVGHEITHGFDDEGRKFDEKGNLTDWWTDGSAKKFVEKTQCVVKQFSDSVAIEDVHVNGELTLGENTADLGGLKLAFAALQEWQKSKPAAPSATGLTPAQQFFLGYGQSWCSKFRVEAARVRAATDPHSPPFLRVNNPLSNLPAFAEAFGCHEGDKMVRPAAARCEVW